MSTLKIVGGHIARYRSGKLLFVTKYSALDDIGEINIKGKKYNIGYTNKKKSKFQVIKRINVKSFTDKLPKNIKQIGPCDEENYILKCDDSTFWPLEKDEIYYYCKERETLYNALGNEVDSVDVWSWFESETCEYSLECLLTGIPALDLTCATVCSSKLLNLTTININGRCHYFHESNEETIDLTLRGELTFEDHFITTNGDFKYLKAYTIGAWDYMLTTDITKSFRPPGADIITKFCDSYTPSTDPTIINKLIITCTFNKPRESRPVYINRGLKSDIVFIFYNGFCILKHEWLN